MTQSTETNMQPHGILWMVDLHQPLPIGPTLRIPAVFVRAGPGVAQELAQAMGLDDPSVVLQRFASGRHCYIARIEGKFVTYGWVTFDEECIGELGLNFCLKAGDAYIWNCATLLAYRGLRLYPALLAHILRELQHQGLHRVWIGADSNNLASQKGMTLAGFEPIADLFMTDVSTTNPSWARGRSGVPDALVTEVCQALSPSVCLQYRGRQCAANG